MEILALIAGRSMEQKNGKGEYLCVGESGQD